MCMDIRYPSDIYGKTLLPLLGTLQWMSFSEKMAEAGISSTNMHGDNAQASLLIWPVSSECACTPKICHLVHM